LFSAKTLCVTKIRQPLQDLLVRFWYQKDARISGASKLNFSQDESSDFLCKNSLCYQNPATPPGFLSHSQDPTTPRRWFAMRVTFLFEVKIEGAKSGCTEMSPENVELKICDDLMENYISQDLADFGLIGGETWFVHRIDKSHLKIVFWAPEAPSEELVSRLKTDVIGQLEDGLGEGGFEFDLKNQRVVVQITTFQSIQVHVDVDEREVLEAPSVVIAARDGNLLALKSALEKYPKDINRPLQGYSALHYAILNGHVEIVATLLKAGSDPNLPDPMGTKPIEQCALTNVLDETGSLKIAQLLIGAGAKVSEIAKEYAKDRGKIAMIAILGKERG